MSVSFWGKSSASTLSHSMGRTFCAAMLLTAVIAGNWLTSNAYAQPLNAGDGVDNGLMMNGPRSFIEPAPMGTETYFPDETIEPQPDMGMLGADCGYSCPPRWYAQGEAFWLSREHEDEFTFSQAFELPSFDYRQHYRFTVGHTYDCLDGWEMTYVGAGRWRETSFVTGADLDSTIIAGPGFTSLDFTAFNNAQFHAQNHESELHSFEINRRWWGWDVFSVKFGGRYIHLDEEYWFLSQQAAGNQGFFLIDTQNDLLLWQLGIDLMRPYGRLTTGGKLNGGIGININDGDALVINANDVKINRGDKSEELGFLVEAGFYAIYRLTGRLSLHAGYETWFFGELALANEQVKGPVDVSFGRSFDETDELFVHGAHAGIELVW